MIEIDLRENPFLIFQDGKLKAFSEIQNLVAANKPDNDIIKKVLQLAEDERKFGNSDFKETEGPNRGPQIRKYCNELLGVGDGIPWCCVFVCWCLMKCQVNFIKTADTWALYDYAKEKGILSDVPGVGDIFLQIGADGKPIHTGFELCIDTSDTRYFLSREGNSGDSIKNRNDKLIKDCKFVKWQRLIK